MKFWAQWTPRDCSPWLRPCCFSSFSLSDPSFSLLPSFPSSHLNLNTENPRTLRSRETLSWCHCFFLKEKKWYHQQTFFSLHKYTLFCLKPNILKILYLHHLSLIIIFYLHNNINLYFTCHYKSFLQERFLDTKLEFKEYKQFSHRGIESSFRL